MATCAVSGSVLDIDGTPAMSVTVFARIPAPQVSGTSVLVPFEISSVADASGNFVMTIQQSISVIFTVQYPIVGTEALRIFNYAGTIPATTTASFSSIIVVE